MEIKICGITREEEIIFLSDDVNRSDYAGFVLYEKSKRYIELQEATKLIRGLKDVVPVAVTVGPSKDLVEEICESGFEILQIHKELTEEVLEAATIPIWYALNVTNTEEIIRQKELLDSFPKELTDKIVGIVVDAAAYGSGKTFDWSIDIDKKAKDIFENRKFILAGGLTSENVTKGIKRFKPDVVDVSSGVEGKNGKDETLVKKFIERVRNYE